MDNLNSNIETRIPKSRFAGSRNTSEYNDKESGQYRNPNIENSKRYDLEARTLNFARRANQYIKVLSKNLPNLEIAKQLVRSAGSIGANYIEANEALGKKDFLMRIKISRKEAKETHYWLSLSEPFPKDIAERDWLSKEAIELMNIFGAIWHKST